jgi:hypothetical protein
MAVMRTTAVLASDTSLEAERVQVELWRKMSPIQKVRVIGAGVLPASGDLETGT